MELRHLRYFVAVAEEENVTRAARRLHLSQPPLTRQIHELEDELGIALFTRTGKSIRLTPAGRLFLREAKQVLARADRAVEAVRELRHGLSGRLTLGYAPSPTAGFLPPLLRRFRQEVPGVQTVLRDLSTTEMLAGLRKGTLHAAFMVNPGSCALGRLRFVPLQHEQVVVAVAPHHPVAERGHLSPAELLKLPLVVLSMLQYPEYFDMVQRILGPRARRLRPAEECDSGPSLVAAVAAGVGVAVTGEHLVQTSGQRLVYLPIKPAPPPLATGLAYNAAGASPMILRLVEVARDSVDPAGAEPIPVSKVARRPRRAARDAA